MRIPGFSLFSPPKPKAPVIPPTPPERRNPIIIGAGQNQLDADRKRRGRAATILNTPAGVTDETTLGRPAATLGG